MTERDNRATGEARGQALDDRGTDTTAGLALLRRLRDAGFDSDDEKLAIALGRPIEVVKGWMDGSEAPDDDIIIKARGIAQERGLDIE